MPNYDVIIAGYGPTGAVAANLIGAQGHRVLVVEPNLNVYEIPRAVHFDGEVMRIFQALGLAEEIREHSEQGEGIRFTNGRNWNLFQQDLTAVPRHHGWFNSQFFDQPQLEQRLREGVMRYNNVELRLGWAVTALAVETSPPNLVKLQLSSSVSGHEEELAVQTRYLLACDGASSPIRKMLNIAQEDLHCDEPWLVCDLKLGDAVSFDRTALQVCDPKRPTSMIPCEGDHIRWEFMLNANDEIAVMEKESNVRALMAPHMHRLSPQLTGEDGKLIRAKVYTFHALLAETFQRGAVFLLGDAAHQTPPFLGQGMCAGIRDAHNLAWKLDAVLRQEHPASLLDTYTTERRPQVREVIATAVTHGSVIQTRNPIKALLRDSYLMLGRIFPLLTSFLKFGETWKIGSGLLATDGAPDPKGPIGEPFPQGEMQQRKAESGEPAVWSDELLGDDFTLVGFDLPSATLLAASDKYAWLSPLDLGPNGSFEEADGEMMRWVETHEVVAALVRPDRQVYGVCKPGPAVQDELQTMLSRLDQRLQ